MNLVRLGHYFTPSGDFTSNPKDTHDDAPLIPSGSCRTALVAGHDNYGLAAAESVNVVVWDHRGYLHGNVTDVPIAPVPLPDGDSFHLSGDCPWSR